MQSEGIARDNGLKRRRVSIACSACRARKSRCNGERPKCSSCDSHGYECTYEQPLSSAPDGYIGASRPSKFLEARVADLEEVVQSLRSDEPGLGRLPALDRRKDDLHTIGRLSDSLPRAYGGNVDALASIMLTENNDCRDETPHFD
ncbi:hypothetical protein EDD37DRAFT_382173 [Exophiala viscosa]|uniref:uncharacterized protein n=1 Tax=Exophiala viscosa TaxID=2486360 RepID=UPI00219475C0|nr:hypothetical protein EDD37DRAFT_382173 [Exophiala viscosa]